MVMTVMMTMSMTMMKTVMVMIEMGWPYDSFDCMWYWYIIIYNDEGDNMALRPFWGIGGYGDVGMGALGDLQLGLAPQSSLV